jgi:hypothetical protein
MLQMDISHNAPSHIVVVGKIVANLWPVQSLNQNLRKVLQKKWRELVLRVGMLAFKSCHDFCFQVFRAVKLNLHRLLGNFVNDEFDSDHFLLFRCQGFRFKFLEKFSLYLQWVAHNFRWKDLEDYIRWQIGTKLMAIGAIIIGINVVWRNENPVEERQPNPAIPQSSTASNTIPPPSPESGHSASRES